MAAPEPDPLALAFAEALPEASPLADAFAKAWASAFARPKPKPRADAFTHADALANAAPQFEMLVGNLQSEIEAITPIIQALTELFSIVV